ncbi:MAG: hypothetical protein JJ895_06040 [Balneolaceae bacterium]|nr:hypothetical protein [Balneolaceae bacterium]
MNYRVILLLSTLLISCSLFNNEQQIVLDEEFIVGEWVLTDFDGDLNLVSFSQVDTSKLDNYIYYNFTEQPQYWHFKCEIIHSKKPINYNYCRWRVDGKSPDLYLTLHYNYDLINWTSLFHPPMDSYYLYKVTKLNQNSLNLDYIFQGPTEDTFIPEDQER